MDIEDVPAYEPPVISLPFSTDETDAKDTDFLSRANSLCATAETIYDIALKTGQQLTLDEESKSTARAVFQGAPLSQIRTTAAALQLTALLQEYDHTVVQSAAQLRNFCINKLIQKASLAHKDSDQLRAIEMLGKVKDVGLFEERSAVVVENLTTDELKKKLKEKMGKIFQVSAQPVTDVEVK